jgi:hypothetical protein
MFFEYCIWRKREEERTCCNDLTTTLHRYALVRARRRCSDRYSWLKMRRIVKKKVVESGQLDVELDMKCHCMMDDVVLFEVRVYIHSL